MVMDNTGWRAGMDVVAGDLLQCLLWIMKDVIEGVEVLHATGEQDRRMLKERLELAAQALRLFCERMEAAGVWVNLTGLGSDRWGDVYSELTECEWGLQWDVDSGESPEWADEWLFVIKNARGNIAAAAQYLAKCDKGRKR